MPAVAEVQFKATGTQLVVTAFKSVGTAAGESTTKIQQSTTAIKSMDQGMKTVASSIGQTAQPINSLNRSLDQSSKSATTFGQKLKGFGSQFGSSIATIGTLSGTILNLGRQYQDLGDTQIAVDKAQLKVSKTTEAAGVAQGKLNELIAKGVTSGAEYDKALLDVQQSLEAQSLAEQMLTERQEDHQRAQENFWIGLVPTVTSAGASIISVLNDIGGTKGIGGLKTALGGLKSAFSVFSGAGGLASGLGAIGTAAGSSVTGLNGMATATTGLSTAMKGLALSALPVGLAIGGLVLVMKPAALVIHEIVSLIKGDVISALDSAKSMLDFFDKIGPIMAAIPGGAAFNVITKLAGFKEELARVREEAVKTAPAIRQIPPELQAIDTGAQGVSNTIDAFGENLMGLIGTTGKAEESLPKVGTGITSVGTAASTATPQVAGFWTELAASTIPEVITWTSDWDAMMKLLNPTIDTTTTAVTTENSELSLLVKTANVAVNAFQNMSRRQQELAGTLAKATANMNKQAQAAQKLAHFQYGGAGKGPSGSHYTVFRNGKPIASGSGMAPPLVKQHGYQSTVKRPTMFLAGEGGRPEDVTVRPRGSVQRGGSAGGGGGNGPTTINVYVDGVLQRARYTINENQGVFK